MKLSQQEALMFVAYGVLLAYFGAMSVRVILQFIQKLKFEQAYLKGPRLVEYSAMRACNEEPHAWYEVVLALRGLEPGKYRICTTCGAIIGNDQFMLSNEALDQIEEGRKLMAQKEELQRQVNARIEGLRESYVDHYIARNFKQEVNDVHFAEKLRALGKYSVTALADASEKVAAELTAQTELDKRYEAWPSKIKGNA